jgi:hypothetical protein
LSSVFIVMKAEYDDYEIVGVFSSQQKAEEYLNESELDKIIAENPGAQPITDSGCWLNCSKWDYYQIKEMAIDELSPLRWCCFPNQYEGERKPLKFIGTSAAMEAHQESASEY